MPQNQKQGVQSALLLNWVEYNSEWDNPQLEEDFTKILKLREIVTKAIEPLRADKKVGSSLEVAVYISGGEQDLAKKYESELANIFIVSQAFAGGEKQSEVLNTYEEDGYKIEVTKAIGEKCERCWKYRQLGSHQGYSTICDECYEAIK